MKRLFAVLALCATAVVAAPATAGATDTSQAKILGPVKVRGDYASVKVRYSCAQGTHIWVSAKQTANGRKDVKLEAEGSAAVAATWWQSHRNYFRCDGKRHVGRFYIDAIEPGSKGRLRRGVAWVQFCITTEDPNVPPIVNLFEWVKVKVEARGKRHHRHHR